MVNGAHGASQRQQDAKASKAAAEQAEREEAALLQNMVAENLQSAKDAAKAEELQQQELEYDDVKERERALAVASVGTLELLGHLESTLGDLIRRLLERAMGEACDHLGSAGSENIWLSWPRCASA